jgi:hypothetical protein
VIVWINGPFGVGKTTAAGELCRRLPLARPFDPETIGWLIKRTVGRVRPGDYQQTRLWRVLTPAAARWRARGADPLIVPMSVLRPEYVEDLLARLRRRGTEVEHVLLDASAPVLRARIHADAADPAARGWRLDHVETYLAARDDLRAFGPTVDTDVLTPAETASAVEQAVALARTG